MGQPTVVAHGLNDFLATPYTPIENALSQSIIIRAATAADAVAIRSLHQTVATRSGGIARYADEISDEYVNEFITRSLKNGIIVVAESTENHALLGELHTYPYGIRRLAHVLTSLTVVIHPDAQGQGVGRRLFESLIDEVREHRSEILRIELIVQESNTHARRLYDSVGFREEGRLIDGILSTTTGLPENDVPMAWVRRTATR
ncbi:MAG: GNAT family N-acetyltransferase [Gemmatimonas sp.]